MTRLAIRAFGAGFFFVLLNGITKVVGDRGKEFLLAFPKDHSGAKIYISFILRGQGSATVTAKMQGHNMFVESLSSPTKRAKTVLVQQALIANESKRYSASCVRIHATDIITVIVFSNFNDAEENVRSVSSFMALSSKDLSTKYIAVTSCKPGVCFILVASRKGQTGVQVVLALRSLGGTLPAEIEYDGKTYKNKDVINEILQAWDSFQILGNSIDLTGTQITSDKPVAVFSGGGFDEANDAIIQDKAIEQLFPIGCLGQKYVLRGPHNRPGGQFKVRIAKMDSVMGVGVHGNVDHTSKSAFSQILWFGSNQTVILTMTQPVLAVLEFPPRQDIAGIQPQDESMGSSFVLAVPVSNWRHRYRVYLFQIPFHNAFHQVVLMKSTQGSCADDNFQIEGNKLTTLEWSTTNSEYQAASANISSYKGDIVISYDGDEKCYFGGYVYSYTQSGVTWAYPLGWDLEDCKAFAAGQSSYGSHIDTNSKETVFRDMNEETASVSNNFDEILTTITPSHKSEAVQMSSTFSFPVIVSQYPSQELLETRSRKPYNSESILTKATHDPTISVQHGEVSRTLNPSSNMKDELALTKTVTQTSGVDILSTENCVEIFPTESQINSRQTTTSYLQETTATSQIDKFSFNYFHTTEGTPTAQTIEQVRMAHTKTILTTYTQQYDIQSTSVVPNNVSLDLPNETINDSFEENDSNKTKNRTNSYTLVLCPCECPNNLDWVANMTTEEIEEQTKAIVRTLQVNKSILSKTIRSKTSALDRRAAPAYLASFIAGFLLIFIFSFIIIPDLLRLFYHVLGVVKKRKHRSCISESQP